MKTDRSGRILASILGLLLLGGCATSGPAGGASGSPAQATHPAPSPASSSSVGVGVGTGGVRVGGGLSAGGNDPIMNSVMTGFILGSLGGPIGSGIGAVLGYFHGLSTKKKLERQVRLEADRQKKLDEEIERQILAQRGGGVTSAAPPASPPVPERGVIFVKDHLEEQREPPGRSRAAEFSQELESQILAQEGGAVTTLPVSPAVPELGVIVVKDHLDEGQGSPGGSSATDLSEPDVVLVKDHLAPSPPARAPGSSASPTPEPASPAPTRGSTLARVPPGGIDREGFRTIYDGERVVRRERDLDDDGKPDVIVHYGSGGQPIRREESSQLDGRIDTWTFYANGKAERKEADTDGDGGVDLWAFYGPEGALVRLKSLVDPRRSLTQFYEHGQVVREEWRREPGGQLQARQTYQDGQVREKEEDSSGDGQLDLVSIFDAEGQLVKQGRRGGDGRMVAWRYFDPEPGTLLREEEIGERGEVVAVSYYQSGRLARRELYELKDELFKRVPLLSERDSTRGG